MAGGLGSRLRPLTATVPKPLLPVVGRPMLEHILRLLRQHDVEDVVITVQHLATLIRSYVGDGSDLGMTIGYSTEHRPLGTAGGVLIAAESFDEDFLVLSGDSVMDIDLSAVVRAHHEAGAALTMCLTRRADPREFGLVDIDGEGRVLRFREKPGWGEVFGDTVSTGIYVVSPHVLSEIAPDVPQDWSVDVIPRLLALGQHVHGHVADGYWEDVGEMAAYRQVQIDALQGLVRLDMPATEGPPGVWRGEDVQIAVDAEVQGPVFVGAHSVVEGGARLEPYTVVGTSAVIRGGATLDRATLADNVYVGVDAQLRGCVVGRSVEIGNGSLIAEAAVVADECALEREVEIAAGSIVYPGKRVESGSMIHGALMWDSKGHRHLLGGGGASGLVAVDITPEVVVRLASALATNLPKGAVVTVGRDTSRSARSYTETLIGALTATGVNVRRLRATPTPVLRHDVATSSQAGVMLRTTPGNAERLDIVLMDKAGRDISEAGARSIERLYERRDFRRPFPGEIGESVRPEVVDNYIHRVRRHVRLDGVQGAGITVVVDTCGGSGALVLPKLLHEVDVNLIVLRGRLNEELSSMSEEQRRQGLRALGDMVLASGASLGISLDQTGERISLVDERGQVLDDDRALLVIVDLVAAEHRSGHVVLPVTTSRIAELVAQFHGIGIRRVSRAEVFGEGEGALLAGDGIGGFALPASGMHLDGMATALALIGLVARTNLTLSAIDERIPRSTVLTEAVATPWSRKGAVMRVMHERAQHQECDLTEGVRFVEPDGAWVLVLPDPQEPLTRLWAEASTPDRAHELATGLREVIERVAAGIDD